MRTVALDLFDPDSVQNAIDELNKYADFIQKQVPVFVQTLADKGVEIAKINFSQAEYDGTNDVTIHTEGEGKSIAVVATGNATLFIEFGTGVLNPADHPDPVAAQYPHGEYGYGLGKLPSWRYKGDPGTNGYIDPRYPDYITTVGNPANASLYHTVEDLKRMFKQVAEEVFKYD